MTVHSVHSVHSRLLGKPMDTDTRTFEVDDQRNGPGKRSELLASLLRGLLLVAVVLFGCANNISKQIASKPLRRYTYMLGLSTAVAYVPLYWLILSLLVRSGVAPRFQLKWVWQRNNANVPVALLLVIAALGDSMGDVIGAICTPHVSGPVHSLLSNCTPIFIASLSMCLLHQRYSLWQSLALIGVLVAVVIGVLPSFHSGNTSPFFAVVLGGSCIFNAVAFVVKELIFSRYQAWATGEDQVGGLNIFVVNAHEALFQLPLTLLLIPLNQMLKQTNGEDIGTYLKEAMLCVFQGHCDEHGDVAGTCVAVYVVFNVVWNMTVLLSVKHTGALATFIALKAIFPVSTVLFAYIDWPLLGETELSSLVWLSIVLLLPSIAFYQWSSREQAKRVAEHPSLASCCWPLCRGHRDTLLGS
ncbi:unnamed protein product [Effrenium voratum]|uniref:Uncharacterized protein n=1 Tax=Effrenium voratum TaxID=2562239 RepID=A0AA36MQ49_9DINO|nr:unnamed protein product [Effrenium voratum]CAJ1424742.1 unnamed protein product [Effrenium voratum]